MEIKRIDTMAQFDELKSDWERAYAADPHAHVFVSWAWLRGWFEITPYHWFVLAARYEKGGPFVAFFPLAMRYVSVRGFLVLRELHMGGKPFSDYTGFVSVPNHEASAIAAFGSFIRDQLKWDRFCMTEVVDARLDDLPSQFAGGRWIIEAGRRLPCPYIPLAESWETHMQRHMSVRNRAGMRRSFKRVEELPGFYMTNPVENDLDQHINTLITLREVRWGRMSPEIKDRYQYMYRHAFKSGLLWLKIIWNGPILVAGLAGFVDPVKRIFYAHTSVFNQKFASLSPGKAIVGYSIRDAIKSEFSAYDLLLGGEDYKYTIGATERMTTSVIVVRRGLREKVGSLLIWLRAFMKKRLRD